MKTLQNKKITIEIASKSIDKTYADLLIDCINVVPEGGFKGLEKMERMIKVINVLREEKDEIAIEDADHEILFSAVDRMGWVVLSQPIVEFVRDVKEMN